MNTGGTLGGPPQSPHKANSKQGKRVYFFVVWSFLLFVLFGCYFFLLFGRWRVFFCCLGGGPGPAQTAKKNTPPPKLQKKTRPAPSERVFFLLFGRVGVFIFFAVWARGVFFFCCLGGGVVFLFLLLGRGRVFVLLFGRGRVLFFAVWAGGVFLFLLFGRGTGVHSLTRLPGSSLSDPTTKETEQKKKKKKKHGFPASRHWTRKPP